MKALELIAYCREYGADIYIRMQRGDTYQNVPLIELTPLELLECLERWLLLGATPVRVLRGQT